MVCPSSDEDGKVGNRYSLVIAVAKRAKQLREGAPKLVESKSRNLITIALEEIASGKVKIVLPTQEQLEAVERKEVVARPAAREAAELLRVPTVEDEAKPVQTDGAETKEAEQKAVLPEILADLVDDEAEVPGVPAIADEELALDENEVPGLDEVSTEDESLTEAEPAEEE